MSATLLLVNRISGTPPEHIEIKTDLFYNMSDGCCSLNDTLNRLESATEVVYANPLGNRNLYKYATITFDTGKAMYAVQTNKTHALFKSAEPHQTKTTPADILKSAKIVNKGYKLLPNAIIVHRTDNTIVRLNQIEDIRFGMTYTPKSPRGPRMIENGCFESEQEIGFGMITNNYGQVRLTELGANTWSVYTKGTGYWPTYGLD